MKPHLEISSYSRTNQYTSIVLAVVAFMTGIGIVASDVRSDTTASGTGRICIPYPTILGGGNITSTLQMDIAVEENSSALVFNTDYDVPQGGDCVSGTGFMARGFIIIDNAAGTEAAQVILHYGTPGIQAEMYSWIAQIPAGAILPLPFFWDLKIVPGVAKNNFFVEVISKDQPFTVQRGSSLSILQFPLQPSLSNTLLE